MPGTNDFLPFAVGGSASVVSQATYAALTTLLANGFQVGVADETQLNKVWRQSSIMSAVLAQFIVDETGSNAVDDGTTATLLANLKTAISSLSSGGVKNKVANGAMQIAQRAISAALTTAAAFSAIDRFFAYQTTTANGILAQSAGSNGFQYFAKIGRNNGATETGGIYLGYAATTADSIALAGKTCTLSWYAKAGTNFSAASSQMKYTIMNGTGTDGTIAQQQAGTWTGFNSIASAVAVTITTTLTRYSVSFAMPSNATQFGINLFYVPAGTAGADDNLYITGVQVEEGSAATAFEHLPIEFERLLSGGVDASNLTTGASVYAPGQYTGFRNLLVNGDCSVAQEYASTGAAITASGATYQIDQFSAWANGTIGTATISAKRVDSNVNEFRYALRVSKSANTLTSGNLFVTQTLDMTKVFQIAGKLVTFSFKASAGAAFSGATPTVSFYMGTGANEESQILGLAGSWTGFSQLALTADPANPALIAGTYQTYVFRGVVPGGSTQLQFLLSAGASGASGGANDYLDLTGFQLEIGGTPTPFEHLPPQVNLAQCQRYLWTSFPAGTACASNAGTQIGGPVFSTTAAGVNVSRSPQFYFPVTMRATPSMVAYSPLAAGGEARDITGNLACTGTLFQTISPNGFQWKATGNAATALGYTLEINAKASAQF